MSATYTSLRYHMIFSTKNREPMITHGIKRDLHDYISGIIVGQRGVSLEVNGVGDHVHVLAGLPPTISIAQIMKRVKGASSWWVNDQGRLDHHFAWQPGYGAFTVSESQVSRVREYIRNQEEHHRVQSSEEEMQRILMLHGLSV